MRLAHFHGRFGFPAKAPPAWAPKVSRWTQLDEPAFLLPEAFFSWSGELTSRPVAMLLSGRGASNLTDHAFASTGAVSPTKFVHTLPNIRASGLLLVMGWEGPVCSLHRDPCTLAACLREGLRLAAQGEVWVWHVSGGAVDLFVLNATEGPYRMLPRTEGEPAMPDDSAILRWFSGGGGVNFDISQQWTVARE